MATNYPNDFDKFFDKENYNSQNAIIRDEEITIPAYTSDPVYLGHDNVLTETVEVWTGTNKTGTKVTDLTVSQDAGSSWRYYILFGTAGVAYAGTAYLSYEIEGDTVEAEDVNNLQHAVEAIEKELGKNPKGDKVDVAERLSTSETRLDIVEAELQEPIVRAVSFYIDEELDVEIGALTFVSPIDMEIQEIRVEVDVAPLGLDDLILDINVNGTSVYLLEGSKPNIPQSQYSFVGGQPDNPSILKGDKISLDIDQVGNQLTGENLSVTIICHEFRTL